MQVKPKNCVLSLEKTLFYGPFYVSQTSGFCSRPALTNKPWRLTEAILYYGCRVYTSGSVAENSSSTWQGAKISASADILAPTKLYLIHNLINTTSG